jgi:hypothetical protein
MRLCAVLVWAAMSSLATARAQTVDEILSRHAEAVGGIDNWRAVRSLRMSGRVTAGGGREALVVREVLRPGRIRTEFTYQGMTGVYAFDGERGWRVSPFDGSFAPEPMADDEERQLRDQADIEGPLVDWKAKGHQVVLSGKKSLDGREVYELQVTLRQGRVLRQYLDARSFLLHRTESTRLVRGHPVEIEATFDDYRKVEGILIPHAIVTGAVGRPQRLNVVIEEVEVNPALDDGRFEMPAAER